MTREELLKKDWQLLTSHTLLTNHAYLRTIFQMQAYIISKIENISLEDAMKMANENLQENIDKVDKIVKEKFDDYPTD